MLTVVPQQCPELRIVLLGSEVGQHLVQLIVILNLSGSKHHRSGGHMLNDCLLRAFRLNLNNVAKNLVELELDRGANACKPVQILVVNGPSTDKVIPFAVQLDQDFTNRSAGQNLILQLLNLSTQTLDLRCLFLVVLVEQLKNRVLLAILI